LNDTYLIDSIIKSKNFDYLKELNINSDMKKRFESLNDTKLSEDILNIIYPKELGFNEMTKPDDILNCLSKTIFKNAYDLLK
jgi:hypothetical protein